MNISGIRKLAMGQEDKSKAIEIFSDNVKKYYIKKTIYKRLQINNTHTKEELKRKKRVISKARSIMKILGFKVENIFKEETKWVKEK